MLEMRHKTFFYFLLFTLHFASCSKVEYRSIADPAYIRVFNNLNYQQTLNNIEEPMPFLAMLIDPEFDANGLPVQAAITGDHLDLRKPYAGPFEPVQDGSFRNYEFPGKQDVLRAPVVNGFDLASWAQIPAGKHRVVFYTRPISATAFFNLEDRQRSRKLLDTTIDVSSGEVYTWHILQKDFTTKENKLYVRQETFQKQQLSDSLTYVNFYNLSAKGFIDADESLKPKTSKRVNQNSNLWYGIQDQMNIYYSLHRYADPKINWVSYFIPGYNKIYMGNLSRNTESGQVTPYFSFPLFADPKSDGISTDMYQAFYLMAPGLNPNDGSGDMGDLTSIICYSPNGKPDFLPQNTGTPQMNLIIQAHSGQHNPKSFATVNSIEIINGDVYLITNRRKYAPPIY